MAQAVVVLIGLAGAIARASVFGAIHDLVTWQISPEYYTALRFWQFQLHPPETANAFDLWCVSAPSGSGRPGGLAQGLASDWRSLP
jgi:hypothetical protein